MNKKALVFWTTKEGRQIDIRVMASSHLLNTIHYIERNRLQKMTEVASMGDWRSDPGIQTGVQFYSEWPEEYQALIEEAQRRNLISRERSNSTALVRKRK